MNERVSATIEDAVRTFIDDLDAQGRRGCARHYGQSLKRLLPLAPTVAEITPAHLRRLMGERARVLKPSSLLTFYYVLAAFFRWASVETYPPLIAASPLAGIPRPKARRAPHRYLSADELRAMYDAARDDTDRLIMLLCGGVGLRVSELVGLRRRDLDMDRGRIRIVGKGRQAAELTVAAATLALLSAQPSDPLVGLHGRDAVRYRVRTLGLRAGVQRPLTTHMLRHSFAVAWLTATDDAFTLQALLRHSSSAMTDYYVRTVRAEAALRKAASVDLAGRLFGTPSEPSAGGV